MSRFALLPVVSWIPAPLLAHFADAATAELRDVIAAWRPWLPWTPPDRVEAVSAVSALTDDDVPVMLVGALPPEDANFLAYHDIRPDRDGKPRPFGVVLAAPGMSLITVFDSAFHEIAETVPDPWINLYDNGKAREVCDPVQGAKRTREGMTLCAWVMPRWAGLAQNGPTMIADEPVPLPPGEHLPEGYVMHQDGTQDPAGYRAPSHKDHAWNRAARRALG